MARKKAVIPPGVFAARVAAYPETMSGYERESLAAEAILAERRKKAKIKKQAQASLAQLTQISICADYRSGERYVLNSLSYLHYLRRLH